VIHSRFDLNLVSIVTLKRHRILTCHITRESTATKSSSRISTPERGRDLRSGLRLCRPP